LKRWHIFALVSILLAAVVVDGYLHLQINKDLKSVQSRVVNIEEDVASDAYALLTHTTAMEDVVKKVQTIIVRIDVEGANFIDSGSGVMVNRAGYILTNNHVIADGGTITVTLMAGDKVKATAVGADKTRDLALLKLDAKRDDFPEAILGSTKDVVIGADVIMAGFPLGQELPGPATFTSGIVSAIRVVGGLNFLQSDAEINPGNSGGCVVDIEGKVIGITVAEVLPAGQQGVEGMALAIPIDDAKVFIQKFIK
jgi:serine protease Do